MIEDLEPYFKSIGLPFVFTEPQSAAELISGLAALRKRASEGLRPIIHIDTHGNKTDGIYISGTNEFVSWQQMVDEFRSINLATQNNLCIVSAACFGMHMIKPIAIHQPTPFFLLLAPQETISFEMTEAQTVPFYRALFEGLDILKAYETYLAPELLAFHCEKLLAVALTRYVKQHCMGKGAELRRERLLTEAVGTGMANTRRNRRRARSLAKQMMKPNQQLIDRYARAFLMGRVVPFSIADVMALARGAQHTSNGKSLD